MIIRKLYKFEGSHIVRNCSSDRCKYSIHGHSYEVEVKLEGKKLDNGQMLVDFGLMKGTIHDLIDSFDHCHVVWKKDLIEYKQDMEKWSARLIETPMSPSAESLAIMLHFLIQKIIENTEFNNGEEDVKVHSVVVHETRTGYAEAFSSDVPWGKLFVSDFIFSKEVMKDWKNQFMLSDLIKGIKFVNKAPYQQVIS